MKQMQQILKDNLGKRDFCNEEIKKCPVCGEPLGFIPPPPLHTCIKPINCKCTREENARRKLEEENRDKQTRLNQVISNSIMDKKFFQSTFENWNMNLGTELMYKKGLAYVDKFEEALNHGYGLLLYGNPGTGKTYMSSCIANAVIKKDIPVIVISADGIIQRIRDTFNNHGSDSTHIVINSLDKAALLVIDDLGTENDSDWSRTMIYRIIDNRYRIKKPMIITSNLELAEIKDRYDNRTFDRMTAIAAPVKYEGVSLRKNEFKDTVMFYKNL